MRIDIRVTESDFKESLLALSKSKKKIIFLVAGLLIIIGLISILLSVFDKKNYLTDGIIILCIAVLILFSETSYDRYNLKYQLKLFNRKNKDNYIDYNIELSDEIIVLNKISNSKEVYQYNEIINIIESKNVFVLLMNLNMIQIITKRELSEEQISEIIKIFEGKNIKIKKYN